MDPAALIDSLDRFGRLLPQVVQGITAPNARWKPPDGAWSILEVVSHLCDEEEFDFRVRLRLTLEAPDANWPPIDPPGWAVERRYNERELPVEADRFRQLRNDSIRWLRTLSDPPWQNAHRHPKFGPILAGELLGGWAAHDQLHLRQIAKRLFQLTARDAAPYATGYAGEWTA